MKLTREEALKYHRQMWSDMQRDIGDTNNAIYRCSYKWEWCLKHFPDVNIENNCFLCHYDSTEGNGDCRLCPIDWPKDSEGFPSCCVKMNDDPLYSDYYIVAPISEILALPERKVEDEQSC